MHYNADPDKNPETERGKEWFDTVVATKPHQLRQREYEIDFQSHVGKRIFPDFDKNRHMKEIEPIQGLNMIVGIDPGLGTSAAVWLQILDDAEGKYTPQVRVYRELETHAADFTVLRDRMIEVNEKHYKDFVGLMLYEIDIWGKAGSASAKKGVTPIKILGRKGLNAHYHKSGPDERATIKSHLLTGKNKEGDPAYLIHPRCRRLIAGNCGLYRRKEDSERIDDTEVVHVEDAEGYAFYNHLYLRFKQKPKAKPKKRGPSFLEMVNKRGKKKSGWMAQ
jgi:hypothetical protein